MNLLSLGFPMSYIVLEIGILFLVFIVAAVAGIIGCGVLIFMISIGMIRITPLIDFIHRSVIHWFPDFDTKLKYTIQNTFLIKNIPVVKEKQIFLFHPHGVFSASYFFHSCTDLTKWKKEYPFKTTISRYVYWLPFGHELCEKLGVISNVYWSMKEVLEKGDSLHIIPGGTSEIPLTQSGKMRIKLANRTGIFRLALETGTPLTPVLTYGENELYSVVYPELQKWLQKHLHIFLPIPSWKSIQTWLTLCTEPLKHPIETTIGEPLYVDKIESPTSDDIENLRNLYIEKLKELYKKTKPSSYMDELEIL